MIYLDTCLVIYWVEGHSKFAPLVIQQIMDAQPEPIAISHLIMTEVLVLPVRQRLTMLIEKYQAFFANSIVLALPEEVFVDAARLRAAHVGLKTPDALHLATAYYHGCSAFWTNDNRLQRIAGAYAVNICTTS